MIRIIFYAALLFPFSMAICERDVINPDLLGSRWPAQWIKVSGAPDSEYGVFHFRKKLRLEERPSEFVVHVSADSRYKFYVNGEMVSFGPAAGDYFNWNFETVDLAEHLREGENVVAAMVWNEGSYRQEAQISFMTGFLVQGNSTREQILNTDASWKGLQNRAYAPIVGIGYNTYYVSGPGEEVNMNVFPEGWNQIEFDDSSWKQAEGVPFSWRHQAASKGARDAEGWMLIPRSIPPMELTPQRFSAARLSEGIDVPPSFPASKLDLEIPPHSRVRLLLDQAHLTNAYMQLQFSGGEGAQIEISYAETLFEELSNADRAVKGHRDDVEGKIFAGRTDRIHSSGAKNQLFETLSWRTFRYVQVTLETQLEPLIVEDISSVFTGYPFELNARFDADSAELSKMLEIGWRTARLCAVEIYMDCPYYEQLQYIGDTRIQALVSLYNSGDDRLLKNALNLIDQSRLAEGITMSRHPSTTPQIISTFSLWYIGMLHDYWWYGRDAAFVADKLEGVRQILAFFNRFQGEDGRLKDVPYWLFSDWVRDHDKWDFGEPPFGQEGESSVLDFQLLWAYQIASEMERSLGMEAYAHTYAERADQLSKAIKANYWDADAKLFLDTASDARLYSEHANSMAILTGLLEGDEARSAAFAMVEREEVIEASIYFKYYVHQALAKAGLGDDYVDWLDVWRENIAAGLTTWAEVSEVSIARSDCHAWGSSPNIELYRIVLGIDSAAPGFKRALIRPNLGDLEEASGSIPHPDGEISVKYEKIGDSWQVEISLPRGIDGTLDWYGQERELLGGRNAFIFQALRRDASARSSEALEVPSKERLAR